MSLNLPSAHAWNTDILFALPFILLYLLERPQKELFKTVNLVSATFFGNLVCVEVNCCHF